MTGKPKSPNLTKRSYGRHEWITLDEGQGPSELEQAQKKEKQKERLFETRKAYRQRHKEQLKKYHEKWRDTKQSWESVLRNAWLSLVKEARKKEMDGLPWEVYRELWEAAGEVIPPWSRREASPPGTDVAAGKLSPPWGGEPVPAYTLRAKYFDERFRCMIVREDMNIGWKPGNVKIIAVEGPYRQWMQPAPGTRRVMASRNTEIQELARWEDDGTEDGKVISVN